MDWWQGSMVAREETVTLGKDGVERDPIRKGKCYACGYVFHLWVCPTCQGPHIDAACKICHDDRRHGVVTPPKHSTAARRPAHSQNPKSAVITAKGKIRSNSGWSKGGGS
jgi:hypothetical protein